MARKICVLDDDRQVVKLATRVVEQEGHEVVGFSEPKEAQSWLLDNKCDILVLDLIMPEMSGVDFTEWLREYSPFTRIVNITGMAPVKTLLTCWRKGADSCVLKGKGFGGHLRDAVHNSISLLEHWEQTFATARQGEAPKAMPASGLAERLESRKNSD